VLRNVTVLLWLAIFSSCPVSAGENDKRFEILGLGYNSCSNFLQHERLSSWQPTYQMWLAGFLTGVNREKSASAQQFRIYNVLARSDLDSAFIWLKDYCAKNPEEYFGNAAEAFLVFTLAKEKAQPALGR
jgi:hypothetical protein